MANQKIRTGLDFIFNGEGGGLAITEPATSGAAIAREMQSYYEYTDEQTVGQARLRPSDCAARFAQIRADCCCNGH